MKGRKRNLRRVFHFRVEKAAKLKGLQEVTLPAREEEKILMVSLQRCGYGL